MKLLGAATLGYFSLNGVSAIDGMSASLGGPVPTKYCGRLEDSLVAGDFPANSHPGRYFVKYNRQNRDRFRGFVKCAPHDQEEVTLEDAKARRRYGAMFVRRDRMGLYTCDRETGQDDGWLMKAQWNIKDCPANEAGNWDAFFPSDAQNRIPQDMTEKENPYEGVCKDAPSGNHYQYNGNWVESTCADSSFALMTDNSCVAFHEDADNGGFVTTETLSNGMVQISWSDRSDKQIRGIPCGFKFEDVELSIGGKLRDITFDQTNRFQHLPNVLKDLMFLRTFTFEGQVLTQNMEPDTFTSIGRPKKLTDLHISGLDIDVGHQWNSGFFGPRNYFGSLDSLEISDMSAMGWVKADWIDAFPSVSSVTISDNSAMTGFGANLLSKWNDGISTLDLSGNAMTELPEGASFGVLTNGLNVDLSDNSFSSLPLEAFENIDPLDTDTFEINMSGNVCTPMVNPCTYADMNVCSCS